MNSKKAKALRRALRKVEVPTSYEMGKMGSVEAINRITGQKVNLAITGTIRLNPRSTRKAYQFLKTREKRP